MNYTSEYQNDNNNGPLFSDTIPILSIGCDLAIPESTTTRQLL